MSVWREIIGKLWGKRQVRPYAAEPSREQVANASMILSFAGSPEWDKYADYLCVSLGEAMESAFAALKKGDNNSLIMWTARAESLYRLLTEPQSARAILEKSQQIIIKPLSPTLRD